ncbi:MAG: helix-turn-helix transcriptional regulator [Raoultibacter sp.]
MNQEATHRIKKGAVKVLIFALGFGLCKTATSLAYITAMGSVSSSIGFVSELDFMFAMNAAAVITAASIIVLVLRGRLRTWQLSQVPALIALTLGFFLSATNVFAGMPAFVSTFVFGALSGFALVVFCAVWLEVFAAQQTALAVIEIVVGLLVQGVIVSLLPGVSSLVVGVFSIVALFVSAFVLMWAKRQISAPTESIALKSLSQLPEARFTLTQSYVCLFVLIGVVGILHTSLLGSSSEHIVGDVSMWMPLAVATAITAFIAVLMVRRPNPATIYKICFPCMLLILSLLPFFGEVLGSFTGLVMITCYDICGMVFLLFIVEQARRLQFSSYLLSAFYMGGSSLFLFIGLAIGLVLGALSVDFGLSILTLLAFAAIYPLSLVLILGLRRGRTPAASADAAPQPAAAGQPVAGQGEVPPVAGQPTAGQPAAAQPVAGQPTAGQPVAPPAEDAMLACLGRLAKQASLTRREEEIFSYLARGRSAKYIAEQLVISENTVWAHIKNIYAKLGIHTKQELMNKVDEAAK